MSKTKKKMNTYVKFGLIIFACVIGGGVLGIFTSGLNVEAAAGETEKIIHIVRIYILPIMTGIMTVQIVSGEVLLKKMDSLAKGIQGAEDEEGDKIEFAMEKNSAAGTTVNVLLGVTAIAVLVNTYSISYIRSLEAKDLFSLLAAMIVFILIFIYSGLWSVRYVKRIQKIYPEKAADPTSRKFHKQWVESCDEAEKEVIYQSSYKTYVLKFREVKLIYKM